MAYRVDSDIFDFESLYIVVLIAVLTKNKYLICVITKLLSSIRCENLSVYTKRKE